MTIFEGSSPLVGGRSLASFLVQQETIEGPRALEFVRQIAGQLAVLHEAGMIHRAVTVHAIHLNDAGDCLLESSSPSAAASIDEIAGRELLPELARLTPPEIPREIDSARQRFLDSGIGLDPRHIDLAQLAEVLCQLLTGSPAQAYMRSPRVKAKVPRELRPLLERALGCDGHERFTDMRAFLAALDAAASQVTLPGDAVGSEASPPCSASDEQLARSAVAASDTTPSFVSSPDTPVDTSIAGGTHSANADRSAEAPLPFSRLGHYEIIARIGHGGMGDVYRGYERALDRQVAIKVLPAELARQQDFIRRFQAEATAAAKLIHPNIIQIYFIGEDAGHHFFAMQYVEGESLADLLVRRKKLTVAETLAIVEQALAGLGAAHELGMVHRDIKPGNILLDSRNRRALLADFGLVKSLESSETGHTATGVVMGTVDYISPEQGRGQAVDGRSDLYSLGVLLYHLLSGRLPFEADNPTALIFQHVYEKPPSLANTAPHVPAPLVSMIEKLLAKSPADRYQSAAEVLIDFRAFRSRQPVAAQVQSTGAARPRTTIIRMPEFDDEPVLPAGLTDVAPLGLWQWTRDRAMSLFQKHAPEALQQLQNTQQQVDGAIANYERRQRDGQKLVRDAEAVVAELRQQAREQKAAALAAGERARSAPNPEAAETAREEQLAAERSAAELDRQIADQEEQLEPIRLRQAQAAARVHELRNQRDILNARLKAAGANLRVHGGASRKRRTGWIAAGGVTGVLAVGGIVWLAFFSGRGDDAGPNDKPGDSNRAAAAAPSTNQNSVPVVAGRQNKITALAFMRHRDRDLGMCFAAGDDAGGIHIYQLVSNRPAQQYGRSFSHPMRINQLAFSPDGTYLTSASDDQTLAIWHIKSQRRNHVLEGHTQAVVAFQYAPDGRRILSASKDGTVRLWEPFTEKELKRVRVGGDDSNLRTLAWSEDGTKFLVGSDGFDARMSLYNVEPGEELQSYETAKQPTDAALLLDNATRAVSAGHSALHVWDAKQEKEIRNFGAGVEVAAFTPDARLALTANTDHSVTVWNVETGELLQQYTGHSARVTSVALSSDGRLGASADEEGTIRLWNLPGAPGQLHVFEAHRGNVQCVAFAPDGIHAVSGAADGFVQVMRIDVLELGPFLSLPDRVSSICFSADSRGILYGTDQAKSPSNRIAVRMIDGAGGAKLDRDVTTFRGMKDRVSCAAYSPDGLLVAGGSADGTLRVWEVESQREIVQTSALRTASGISGIICLAFCPDNRPLILWATTDNEVHLWDYENDAFQDLGKTFVGHKAPVRSVQFSPSGRFAVSASEDRTLRIWDVAKRESLHELTGHTGPVNSVAVSRDGRFILSGSDDKTVRKWDLETGKLLFTYRGHTDPVRSVAISPNNQLGLSGSDDWSVRLWDLK